MPRIPVRDDVRDDVRDVIKVHVQKPHCDPFRVGDRGLDLKTARAQRTGVDQSAKSVHVHVAASAHPEPDPTAAAAVQRGSGGAKGVEKSGPTHA